MRRLRIVGLLLALAATPALAAIVAVSLNAHTDLTPAAGHTGSGSSARITFTGGGWSTTFDYGQTCYQNTTAGTPECDSVENDGTHWDWLDLDADGEYSESVVAANNPNGAGGQGRRSYIGDGVNNNSGPTKITFQDRQTEIWIRWYMRYEAGFQWVNNNPSYDKWIYCWYSTDEFTSNSTLEILPQPSGQGGRIAIYLQSNTEPYQMLHPTMTWADIFGHPSNGYWHMVEMYVKMDTDSTDGIGRLWIDGELVLEKTDVDYSNGDANTRLGMKWFDFHQNQSNPDNTLPEYVDYDDIAIYISDPGNRDAAGNPWIGPLNGFEGGS